MSFRITQTNVGDIVQCIYYPDSDDRAMTRTEIGKIVSIKDETDDRGDYRWATLSLKETYPLGYDTQADPAPLENTPSAVINLHESEIKHSKDATEENTYKIHSIRQITADDVIRQSDRDDMNMQIFEEVSEKELQFATSMTETAVKKINNELSKDWLLNYEVINLFRGLKLYKRHHTEKNDLPNQIHDITNEHIEWSEELPDTSTNFIVFNTLEQAIIWNRSIATQYTDGMWIDSIDSSNLPTVYLDKSLDHIMNESTAEFKEDFSIMLDHEWWLASAMFSVLMSGEQGLLYKREDLVETISQLNKL